MSAPITEAHKNLAYELMQMDDRLSAFAHRTAAILIANSEARAVAEWQNSAHIKGEAIDSLLIECDRLRAEVERLTAQRENLLKPMRDQAIARADRAEAELAAERARLDSGTILLTFSGERVWHSGVDLRAAIDAAMKEGAK